MYFSLAVASALPVYAVLNENSPPAPPNSRANVFVSYFDVFHAIISDSDVFLQNQLV